ncbi:MAG: hypothetical protein ACI9JZ_003063 [Lentimonas sp.]|jgi:hypothetical protein
MKFTEAHLESAIIELLSAQGFPHVQGESIARASELRRGPEKHQTQIRAKRQPSYKDSLRGNPQS